jgi:1-acyl-sn-glycerol-3-phosphate acyltransferase
MGAVRPPGDWTRNTTRLRVTRALVRALLRVLFRFRVEGLSHLPGGPAVVVCNHPSALDPLLLGAALPERVLFIAAEEYLAWRGVGWAMRAYGCIPVRRGEIDTSAIREAVEALGRGLKVGVFPEGQISPEPGPVKRGAALLAARARVPLVPVAVIGSGRAFPLGATMIRLAPVTVRIGPPIPPPGQGRGAQQDAMDAVMAWIRAATEPR